MVSEQISLVPAGFDEAFARLSDEGEDAVEAGEDTIEAETGEDTVEAGEDTVEAGEDTIEAETGEDTVEAGAGEDTVEAGAGEDTVEAGEDTVEAGAGEDTVEAGAGEDTVEAGEDTVEAGAGGEDPIARLAQLLSKQADDDKPAPAAEAEPEIYNREEKEFLAEYEKEWPDVARAEALRRRAEYQEVVSHIFNEVAQQMAPMADMLRTLSERTHLQDLQDVVGDDYGTLREQVVEWAKEQPSYLQSAYQHVIERGTVDEVSDLINRFKTETGQGTQTAKTPTREPKKKTELPAQTKKVAAALAPVSSRRSAIPQGEEPTDFDSAFEAHAKTS